MFRPLHAGRTVDERNSFEINGSAITNSVSSIRAVLLMLKDFFRLLYIFWSVVPWLNYIVNARCLIQAEVDVIISFN